MTLSDTIPKYQTMPGYASPLGPHVLLIGDWLTDNWIHVEQRGTTTDSTPGVPQAPHWRIRFMRSYAGGAGNVHANLKALGVRADYVAPGTRPVRYRYVDDMGVQLARVDGPSDSTEPVKLEALEQLVSIRRPQGVVIADYAKGAVTPEVIEWARALGVPMWIDTKRSPMEYVGVAPVALTFFPNQREWDQWKEDYQGCGYPIVRKMGGAGVDYIYRDAFYRFEATNPRPVSTCGAGDVVMAAWVAGALAPQSDAHRGTFPIGQRTMELVGRAVSRPYTNLLVQEDIGRLVSLSDSEESRWAGEGGR